MKNKLVVIFGSLFMVMAMTAFVNYVQAIEPISQEIADIPSKTSVSGKIIVTENVSENKEVTQAPNVSTDEPQEYPDAEDFAEKIDMKKWLYNSDDHVYYQLGITYCRKPADAAYEKLAIFVPEQYMNCVASEDNNYECEINYTGSAGKFSVSKAPFIIPIETPAYQSRLALTEYHDFSFYTKAGLIYVHVGCRGREHGAPAGVTDLKAAIRYLRGNQDNIPGNTDYVVVSGMGSGGGQAAVLGTSGDSQLYVPYLKEIGAYKGQISDAVQAVAVWTPITNLDTANEAYEWNLGATRLNMSEEQKNLSAAMAKAYAQYINKSGFLSEEQKGLFLQEGKSGKFQQGSYYDYVHSIIEDSLNDYFNVIKFPYITNSYEENDIYDNIHNKINRGEDNPEDKSDKMMTEATKPLKIAGSYLTKDKFIKSLNEKKKWLIYLYEVGVGKVSNVKDFVKNMKPATKPIGAYDSLSKSQPYNVLFGLDGDKLHFDGYTAKIMEKTPQYAEFKNDFKKKDSQGNTVMTRLNMYNPLYYTIPSYNGYRTAKVAPVWRIRSGANQGYTPLTTEINLYLAIFNYPGVKNVDFKIIWGKKYIDAELTGNSVDNLIEWINWSRRYLYN